jgi:hypothetical protein
MISFRRAIVLIGVRLDTIGGSEVPRVLRSLVGVHHVEWQNFKQQNVEQQNVEQQKFEQQNVKQQNVKQQNVKRQNDKIQMYQELIYPSLA